LSNPINKFIRYTTTKRENKTINIAIDGLSAYDQLDNALESPIDKKEELLKNIRKYLYIIMKDLNILYLLKINI
jgi:molecular chaperone GrpE (heat shock protein)